MPAFPTRPLNARPNPLVQKVRKHPFIFFGLPFVGIIVGASFALQAFTQTRYDYHQTKVQTIEKESDLGMKADRRKVDLREEYYRLNNPDALPSTHSASSEPSLSSLDARSTAKPSRKKFSMAAVSQDDYEPVRVPRPQGVAEWGAGNAVEEAPLKGYRKEDRWV
ncbi:cytochrome c oxidase-assembly factor COX16 [Cryptococcus wingfieldii CBS 7118]|uniref:Cytochrome c oxidase assembly protein COX16, mitochondrial n=1 Tax=Cryptococcus wingfieldii CBS 7118 TaxID=1295528 RepID=A0A1E3K5N1_9TREE|nr:cytochrome c oxidase-assembly factor COX16 [Cryptococcus wingfieldii CBS 7118]ODO08325.1 cytochrome c oxidase-assembly factor COX16 [Cryptococcus wingfieldii CBS 7118]